TSTRVLAAESTLTAALAEQDEGESARVAEQVSVIDTELREHSVVGARAAALRGREMPTLRSALEARRGGPPAPGGGRGGGGGGGRTPRPPPPPPPPPPTGGGGPPLRRLRCRPM